MPPVQVNLAVPPGIGTDEIASCLAAIGSIHIEPAVAFGVEYRDTFDRRLQRAGQVLEQHRHEDHLDLLWREMDSGTPLGNLACAEAPHFAGDLPSGPLQARIARVVWIRRILPVASAWRSETRIAVRNADGKAVVRLLIQQDAPAESAGTPAQCSRRVCVIPVRGYPESHERAVAALREIGLQQVADDPLTAALSFNGHPRLPAPPSRSVELDAAMPASEGMRRVLLKLSGMIEDNVEGVVEDWDSEFLHDLRVAVRRTRTALRQFRRNLPPGLIERYQPDFRWLGGLTGPARDLDVHLLHFQDYLATLPREMRADLDPLREFLVHKRRAVQADLVRELRGSRFQSLMCDWALRLQRPFEPSRASEPTVRSVADRRIYRSFKRVLRKGRAIGSDAPAAALHQLRMSCKRLRYLIEFFAALYLHKPAKRLVGNLKSLQDNLGYFHDCDVQQRALRAFSEEMMQHGEAPAQTFLAMGLLIDSIQRRQQRAGAEFATRFAAFDSPDNRHDYRRLFKSNGRAETRS